MQKPRPLERDITRAIMDYLHARGCWVLKTRGGLGQRPGVPDILAIVPPGDRPPAGIGGGAPLAIEVKRPGGKPTRAQAVELDLIALAGGYAMVATDVEQVIAVVEALREEEA